MQALKIETEDILDFHAIDFTELQTSLDILDAYIIDDKPLEDSWHDFKNRVKLPLVTEEELIETA